MYLNAPISHGTVRVAPVISVVKVASSEIALPMAEVSVEIRLKSPFKVSANDNVALRKAVFGDVASLERLFVDVALYVPI